MDNYTFEQSFSNKFSGSFPNINIPESDKDENYHRSFVEAITKMSINSTYDLNYAAINENYDFFNGTQSGVEFNFLQEADDGEVLPAQWINYNKINVKINLLLGELDKRNYDIRVRAINKEAVLRRLSAKEAMRINVRMNNIAGDIENIHGIPMGYDQSLPRDDEELELKFEKYQEDSELVVEGILKALDKKNRWRYLRLAIMRDILIAGQGFVKIEFIGGIPVIRRIDPRDIIYDRNATDDFLSDSTYWGEVRYMSVSDAAQIYGLDVEEIKKVYSERSKPTKGSYSNNLSIPGSSLSWFKEDSNSLRVLVITAYWKDYKKKKKKISVDKYGREHWKEVSDRKQDSNNIVSKVITTWRRATLIGGSILKEWGEVPNQVRSVDDYFDSDAPYKAVSPNYINSRSISKVDLLKSLQKLKDITMYNIQLAMARAGAKGFVYDVAQIPDEFDLKTVIKYLKVVGIAFIDSKKDGVPSNYNQFGPIDQTLSDSVSRYLEISAMVDKEMDAISGVNDARQGIIQGSSQAVGVTNSALMQSSLATEMLHSEFQMFSSTVWTFVAGMVRLDWNDNKNKFAYVASDIGIDFLTKDIDIDFNDYATIVEETNIILSDIQSFKEVVIAALQSQQIDFVDAMKLLREKDITIGIHEFEKANNRKKQQMAEQQQAAAEADAQRQQQLQQVAMQEQGQSQSLSNQAKLNAEQIKGQNKLKDTYLKGQFDLQAKKIDAAIKNSNKNNTKQ